MGSHPQVTLHPIDFTAVNKHKNSAIFCVIAHYKRLRWSRGERAGLWYPSSRVQTRPKPSDFSGEKILSTPSFGGEVKPSVHVVNLRHVKEPKSDVEVATFGNFSPIVPPSATGVRLRRFRRWGHLVAEGGKF